MINRIKQDKIEEKGFTLTELIVVLAIIAILAAIAVPVYVNVTDGAQKTSDQANASIVESAVELYAAINGAYPDVTGENDREKFSTLVTLLYDEGFLKQSVISSAEKGKTFEYRSENHRVIIVDQ